MRRVENFKKNAPRGAARDAMGGLWIMDYRLWIIDEPFILMSATFKTTYEIFDR